MQKKTIVWIIALVLVFLVGVGIGGAGTRPITITETSTITQPTTIEKTLSQTLTETSVQTLRDTLTLTQTVKVTETAVKATTITTTSVATVYPAESGPILVSDRGSGNKDTKPFTLDSTSDLKIKIKLTARGDLKYVSLTWYLYNADLEKWLKTGEVEEEQGEFEFYAAKIPAGNWYVRILAANCDWELTVEKTT